MTNESAADGALRNRLRQAGELLLGARHSLRPIADLPAELRPQTLEEAYFVQDVLLLALGGAGGWKVGLPGPGATPLCAPMPIHTIAPSGARIAARFRRMRGVEAEIAFLMSRDLPPRDLPYSREEVVDAIASCHPAIEILESGILDPQAANRMTVIADLQMHGGFVFGEPIQGWSGIDFASETAEMVINGAVRVANGRSPAAGDLIGLAVWLANEGQARTAGRLAGKWITTGSWTGGIPAGEDSEVLARFQRCGSATLRFR